jgi:LPS export ABC transporter protein LptC
MIILLRVLAAGLVIALIVTGWLVLDREESGSVTPAAAPSLPENPGYSARNAQILETGVDGQPMYTVNAKVIREMPATSTVTLDDVQMQLRDDHGTVWTAHADHGHIQEDSALVDLTGDVTVSGVLPGTTSPAVLTTTELGVDTHNQIISTQAPVQFDWSGQTLNARGFVARLKDQQVRLESEVHGRIRP